MEFAELVRKRRTVRRFEDTPVDRLVLEEIARLAQRTPSAGFAQGQRVVIVTEPEQRRRVAATCDEAAYIEMGMGPWISECAAQFIPCVSEQVYRRRYAEPDKGSTPDAEQDWPTPYWWVDIGKTAMVLMLAAHDAGLAAASPDRRTCRRSRPCWGCPRSSIRSASSRSGGRCPTPAPRRSSAAGYRSMHSPIGNAGSPTALARSCLPGRFPGAARSSAPSPTRAR